MNKLSEGAALALKQYKTTPDLIADTIRKSILDGSIAGGETLRQEELAATFGVSRIPVREALRRLEAEGLITIYPHRGAVVAALSSAEVAELYEIRAALETLALRLAFPRLTGAPLERARGLLAALDKEQDVARWGELNREFHMALYAPANRPQLMSMVEQLHRNVDRYMRLVLAVMEHQAHSQDEHRALLAVCERGEQEKALEILAKHITEAGALLAGFLDKK